MPDWFYRTVSKPLLFLLPPACGRDFALGFMGTLARLPGGPTVIDLLGHMRADERLRQTVLEIEFPSPVGLGCGLDGNARALPALARFGFGFLEVGPMVLDPPAKVDSIERAVNEEDLRYAVLPAGRDLAVLQPRLIEASESGLPLIARLGVSATASPEQAATQCGQMIHALASNVQLFSSMAMRVALDQGWTVEQWKTHVKELVDAARSASPSRALLLCVPADGTEQQTDLLRPALEAGIAGWIVDGMRRIDSGGYALGATARDESIQQVAHLRRSFGSEMPIIASGGVHSPADALALLDAGANFVQVDTGLIFTGPGLPKRINDAILYRRSRNEGSCSTLVAAPRPATMSWFWLFLMGLGMFLGSVLALAIAATQVVLPYDEAFVGMSREELLRINPRLLDFMAHDRVTLSGTMVSLGILYMGLSWFAVRRGLHWAQWAIFASAFTGFASFFLFLGFGYLDALHAFVTAVLLQQLLLGVHSKLGTHVPIEPPMLHNEWSWRLSQWGQLLLIIHACGLLTAGLAISCIGVTWVFVPEDLAFMQTTAEQLRSANPRLVPLVAHDRATFGGMLLSNGVLYLLASLWGFRNGSRWLVWMFLLAGSSAYAAAIGVHYAVGYTDFHHLLPAFGGLALFLSGLGLAAPYLCHRVSLEGFRAPASV